MTIGTIGLFLSVGAVLDNWSRVCVKVDIK